MRLTVEHMLTVLFSVVMANEKAILEIVFHTRDQLEYTSDNTERLIGHFSSIGTTDNAEGPVIQVISGFCLWSLDRSTLIDRVTGQVYQKVRK